MILPARCRGVLIALLFAGQHHQCRHGGDNCLARADITLQQPVHGLEFFQILQNVPAGLFLLNGQLKRQTVHKSFYKLLVKFYRKTLCFSQLQLIFLSGQLVIKNFFKGQARLGFFNLRVMFRKMRKLYGIRQR